MANNEWNPDDLLDFHYDHPTPENNEADEIDELIGSYEEAAAGKAERIRHAEEARAAEAAARAKAAAEAEARENMSIWDDDSEVPGQEYSRRQPEPDQPRHAAAAPVPEKKRGLDDSFDSYDELKRYEELGKKTESGAADSGAGFSYARPARAAAEPPQPRPESGDHLSSATESDFDDFLDHELGIEHQRSYEPPVSEPHEYSDPAGLGIAPPLGSRHISHSENSGRVEEFIDRELGSDQSGSMPREYVEEHGHGRSAKELEAIKQASRDAYDRYRSNYTKKQKKMAGPLRVGKFDRILAVIYTIALVIFGASMTLMNILPMNMLAGMFAVLALISLLLYFKTHRNKGKVWSKRFATLIAVILVIVYGVGASYALGTLSFLDKTSVNNEKSVALITRDPFNVVITGIDVRGEIDEQGRSDVNMVVTVNPETSQVLMTSIPRDYEIYMPDKDNAMDKLTHTGFYSVETTTLAEEQLLDTTANYYVKVNFTTVEKFIDAIGGVDVYSEYEFNPVKMKDWTVKEGVNHMNGKQALAFARERKAFLTGDNQRIKNQQAVFEAMIKKATSSRTMIFSYSKILSNLKDYFEMSFSSAEIRSLARMQLAKNPDWKIFKNTIIGGDGSLPTYTTGGAYCYVMTQDAESIENAKTLMNAVLEGKTLKKNDDGEPYVSDEEE